MERSYLQTKDFPSSLPSPTNPTDFFLRPSFLDRIPPSSDAAGGSQPRLLARLARARAQSAFLKGFSPLRPLSPLSPLCAPLAPPPRATLADASAEGGASRRPCGRRPPTRRAQGPLALLSYPHTPSALTPTRAAAASAAFRTRREGGRPRREGEAVAEAVDLVVYGVEVERPERRERREGIKEREREGKRDRERE